MLIELQNVTRRFAAPGVTAPPVLADVSLAVAAGETVSIVGPSGSGKSTLLNIMGLLDRPSEGIVLLEGANTASLGDEQLAGLRSRTVGFVFQFHHLLPQCTALENVLVPTLIHAGHRGRDETTQRAKALLERVGLSHRLHRRPGELSGGERQRVAVVRAVINQPKVILADEPTGSLDSASADSLIQLLLELNREQNAALVLVTHDQSLAGRMGRRLHMRDGRLQPVEAIA